MGDDWLAWGAYAPLSGDETWAVATSLRSQMRVKVRYPDTTDTCPVIIFSHGNSGRHDSYVELTEHWVSRGFVVILPCHADSFPEVAVRYPGLGWSPEDHRIPWQRDALTQSLFSSFILDPVCREDRIIEVRTAIESAESIAAAAGFRGKIDGDRIAVGGHSYGAFTTVVFAGVAIDLLSGRNTRVTTRPLAAAFALSPPSADANGLHPQSWAEVGLPLMMITGTDDRSAGNQDPISRQAGFKLSSTGGRYLAVIDDCDHAFGGVAFTGRELYKDNADIRRNVVELSTAFWEATLHSDAEASRWLKHGPVNPTIAYRAK